MQLAALGGAEGIGGLAGGGGVIALTLYGARYFYLKYQTLSPIEKRALKKYILSFPPCVCIRSILGLCITPPSPEDTRETELIEEREEHEAELINNLATARTAENNAATKVKEAKIKLKTAKATLEAAEKTKIEKDIASAKSILNLNTLNLNNKLVSLKTKAEAVKHISKELEDLRAELMLFKSGTHTDIEAANPQSITENESTTLDREDPPPIIQKSYSIASSARRYYNNLDEEKETEQTIANFSDNYNTSLAETFAGANIFHTITDFRSSATEDSI